jgi:phosphohistidine phosphatase
MRRLVLVRHAKSSWDDPTLADHDRPLAPRGVNALARMRAHVATLELPSLLVLCSTAARAVATFDGIRAALPDDAVIEHDRSIYATDGRALLDRVRAVDDVYESVLVVGHNPTLQDLALTLAGSGDAADREQLETKLPTGAIVTMSFEGGWGALAAGGAALDGLFTPRPPRR